MALLWFNNSEYLELLRASRRCYGQWEGPRSVINLFYVSCVRKIINSKHTILPMSRKVQYFSCLLTWCTLFCSLKNGYWVSLNWQISKLEEFKLSCLKDYRCVSSAGLNIQMTFCQKTWPKGDYFKRVWPVTTWVQKKNSSDRLNYIIFLIRFCLALCRMLVRNRGREKHGTCALSHVLFLFLSITTYPSDSLVEFI